MKKLSTILLLAVVISALMSGIAYANFGPHGGYEDDTDACAGCHRAHTSFSAVTWTDQWGNDQGSALLVTDASTILQFCYACHGDLAPGASTNVESGIFDAGPSLAADDVAVSGLVTDTAGISAAILYTTGSSFEATLNGGGFERIPNSPTNFTDVSSLHNMDEGSSTDPMWGAGEAADDYGTNLTCTGCHDPHGSSNYRLLKDAVNGNTVGGYNAVTDLPEPFVISREIGYPPLGWKKHEAGALQMTTYKPDYTRPLYANNTDASENMSAWCAGCHEEYNVTDSVYDYSVTSTFPVSSSVTTIWADATERALGEWYVDSAGTSFTVGSKERHRHPVNVTIAADWLNADTVTDTLIPLEVKSGIPTSTIPLGTWTRDDGYIGCLTCHRAHGTATLMGGWADSSYIATDNISGSAAVTWYPVIDPPVAKAATGGVNPNDTSALLRVDNRGVCERCHNK